MKEKRDPTLFEALSTIIVLAIIIGIGFGVMGLAIQPLLLLAAAYAGFIAWRVGLSWREMEEGVADLLKTVMPALYILLAVGIIIGTWIYSGTVPYLIYWGLQIIDPAYFLVSAFLLTAIVSVATGTAWGSVGTAGIALIAIALELDINVGMAAGAIISGGVFGDKMSPLSDTTNLAALVNRVNIYDHIRHMMWTTFPASIIGLIVWFIVGLQIDAGSADAPNVQELLSQLDTAFNFSLVMLLPILVIVIGAFKKYPIVPMMLLSSIVALFIGFLVNGFGFAHGFTSMIDGFNFEMISHILPEPNENMQSLLNRGGIMSMTTIIVTILCGYAFAGMIEASGCLKIILEAIFSIVKSTAHLISATVLASLVMVFTAGVASVVIIVVGTLMKDAFDEFGLERKNLSRTLEDAGTMVLPFIPWGTSGIYYTTLLDVSISQFLIWAIPCYLCVVFALIYGWTGFGIAKKSHT